MITISPPKDLTQIFDAMSQRVAKAWQDTAVEIGKEIEQAGRIDIASGGNFGKRWTDGFNSNVTNTDNGAVLTVTMEVPYWRVFQEGSIINGKPMLWIPLSFGDGVGKSAREYGRLFRVDRKIGAPLLLSYDTKRPVYFGKTSVQEKKRFHLIETCERIAKKVPDAFYLNLGSDNHGR